MVVFRETQAVGLGPHLSHLIYIYKSKITKYIYTWSSAPYSCYTSSRALYKSLVGSFVKHGATSVWRILYPLHEIVIHIFTKAHILFCLPCSRYTLVFFLVWLVGPLISWAPSAPTPSHPVSGPGCAPQTTCLGNIRPQATPIESDSTIIPPLRTRGKWFIYPSESVFFFLHHPVTHMHGNFLY
jgi:hypothetical protein